MRTILLIALLLPMLASGDGKTPPWPPVLVIDDFESGLARWENQDSGTLSLVPDAPQGQQALCWTAADDGLGHIVWRNLDRAQIDFSRYDLLVFDVKIDGKPIWNLNPILQQNPAVYGYRGLYYSLDTLHPFGKWFTCSQDLSRWENAWPDSFNPTNQEFQLEVHQLAGSGSTRVLLDNIRLMKNPLKLRPSYPGRWSQLPDGTQVTEFAVPLENMGDAPLTVRAAVAPGGTLQQFVIELPEAMQVRPASAVGAKLDDTDGGLRIRISAPAAAMKALPPRYGETARIAVTVTELPGLVLYTDLAAGTKPADVRHPSIVCSPERMAVLREQYADPVQRKSMDKLFPQIVAQGEQALAFGPEYPPVAATGRTTDPVSGAKLVELDVPTLPWKVYQDPVSGRTYSGPIYDAGMQGWTRKHLDNGVQAKALGLAYLVTGDRRFAGKAASILRPYITVYPTLPLVSPDQGCAVGSVTSGTVPIGSTFMREQTWLADLAMALDSIRSTDVLTEADLAGLAERVFSPSAHNMMDHKVGAMNLQWMIQSSCLMAGLAADLPDVTARALHDSHGIVRLMEVGFLDDGNWWENPSYQNVAKIAAYPAMVVALHNGIFPWNEQYQKILKASYKLYGPDGRSPTLGTGGWTSYDKDDAAVHALSKWISDPELAWVFHNRKPGNPRDNIGLLARFWSGEPSVPADAAVSPIPENTTLASEYGGIALRVPKTDQYCYFHFGRELTHGHRNKLSINAYGKGGWFSRNVMGGYESNFHDFLETSASASSIMVDGKNADQDTGELLFQASVDGMEVASGREVGAWKDVEHERTLVLSDRLLIVIDRCRSESPHRYDWLHHTSQCGLELAPDQTGAPGIERFGESKHYDSLPPTGRFKDHSPARWTREDGSGLVTAFVPLGVRYVTHVTDGSRPHDSLLWRQEGATVHFTAAFLPLAKGEAGEVRIETLPVRDASGAEVGLDQGQAARVTTGDESITVLVAYADKPLTAGTLKSEGRVTVSRQRK